MFTAMDRLSTSRQPGCVRYKLGNFWQVCVDQGLINNIDSALIPRKVIFCSDGTVRHQPSEVDQIPILSITTSAWYASILRMMAQIPE